MELYVFLFMHNIRVSDITRYLHRHTEPLLKHLTTLLLLVQYISVNITLVQGYDIY